MIRLYKRFGSLQSLYTRLRSVALEDSKREREREWSWWIFALRVSLLFLQYFFEAYIPSLSLMIVRELHLTVVRETWIKSRVVVVIGQAINAFVE